MAAWSAQANFRVELVSVWQRCSAKLRSCQQRRAGPPMPAYRRRGKDSGSNFTRGQQWPPPVASAPKGIKGIVIAIAQCHRGLPHSAPWSPRRAKESSNKRPPGRHRCRKGMARVVQRTINEIDDRVATVTVLHCDASIERRRAGGDIAHRGRHCYWLADSGSAGPVSRPDQIATEP